MNPDIYVAGTGNTGTALIHGFLTAGLPIRGVYSRTGQREYLGIPVLPYSQQPITGAVVFLAVPDDVVPIAESHFFEFDIHTIHCAGSVPLNALKHHSTGVFYPLQTWTRGMASDWRGVPVLVESANEKLVNYFLQIGELLGAKCIEADSDTRQKMHLAAVFANNFSNAMFDIASQLAESAGMDAGLLKPLIAKTAAKLEHSSPFESQTGPARRGDSSVLQTHENLLQQNPQLQQLYRLISDYLQQRHHNTNNDV